MPMFNTDVDFDIDPDDYVDECTESEKDELRKILGDATIPIDNENEIAFAYFRGEVNLQKIFRAIGTENIRREVNLFLNN